MDVSEALRLVEYWRECPPAHISLGVLAGTLKPREVATTVTEFETLIRKYGGSWARKSQI